MMYVMQGEMSYEMLKHCMSSCVEVYLFFDHLRQSSVCVFPLLHASDILKRYDYILVYCSPWRS
jgi:hypothetical protein